MTVEATSHHLVPGKTLRIKTSDGRTFFGRWQKGGLELNTKPDFRGRTASIDGNVLADFLFGNAKNQGRRDRLFGDAREVRPPLPKPDKPPFVWGKKTISEAGEHQ